MRRTVHLGITMEWTLAPGTFRNAANPFTIHGYVDGVEVMSHATRARTKEQAEREVVARIEELYRQRYDLQLQNVVLNLSRSVIESTDQEMIEDARLEGVELQTNATKLRGRILKK